MSKPSKKTNNVGRLTDLNEGQDEEEAMSHDEFLLWFLEKNKGIINRYIHKRMIPNRYAYSDVRAYISERILDILQKREAKGNPIKEPKIYFTKLIDYYCIEFQRMHGYIYGMPKRPRAPEAEKEISQYGFVYFHTDPESTLDSEGQLGYIDNTVTNPERFKDYKVKGLDPGTNSDAWDQIMKMAIEDDRAVLTCVYKYNMSVPEASRHLGISVSTAYMRRDRGLLAISGTLVSYVDLDQTSWRILDDVANLEEEEISVDQFIRNRGKKPDTV